jgi:hypothetical protein
VNLIRGLALLEPVVVFIEYNRMFYYMAFWQGKSAAS